MNALIIDDDGFNIEVLTSLLTQEQAGVIAIQNPADLPASLGQFSGFDVVFLDLEMPHLDGYQVLDYLKREVGLTAPIIACTVHTNEATHARQEGFDGFLSKPIDAEAFPEQFRRIINGERVWEK